MSMSIACNGERSIASLTAHLLLDDDRSESQQQRTGGLFPEHRRWPRWLPLLPIRPFLRPHRFKNLTRLAFVSHFCFVSSSMSFLLLSFANCAWFHAARVTFGVPYEVLDEDNDRAWREWYAYGNDKYGSVVDDACMGYEARYKFLNVSGAALFVACGTLDYMRFMDTLNIFMIFAGIAGVVAGLSRTTRTERIWDCISNHLYLLEAYPMLKRDDHPSPDDDDDNNGGHLFVRVGRVCFLGGCLLNVSM